MHRGAGSSLRLVGTEEDKSGSTVSCDDVFFQKVPEGNQDFPPIANGVYVLYCNHQENPIVTLKDPFTEMGVAHALVWFL